MTGWLITGLLIAYGATTAALIHRAFRLHDPDRANRRLIRLYLRRGRKGFLILPSRETTPKRYRRRAD